MNLNNITNDSSINKDNLNEPNLFLKDMNLLSKKKIKLVNLNNQLKKKHKKYKNNLLKLKNRLQKKVTHTYNFCLEKYFLSILSILDSIEKSVFLLDNVDKNMSDFYIHLKDIQKIFSVIFLKYNIIVIDSINVPFNPDVHQAISIDFSKKYKNNYVSCVIQKGYLLNNRLLRPALVSVSQHQ